MAYDDTKWGGFAKIIVDTSTLTAGDTVRVRSMTDANAIYDKTVVTAGTPLIFETEIFKDYVKICTVQDIGGVATEIGGVYKTVDYGQTLFIDIADISTLAGIQNVLDAHSELNLLNIGDEVNIYVGGVAETFELLALNLYDSHEAIFGRKKVLDTPVSVTINDTIKYSNSQMRTACQNYYNSIDSRDKAFIKSKDVISSTQTGYETTSDYCFIPTATEVGTSGFAINQNEVDNNHQFPIFTTQANRVKEKSDGTSVQWATASHISSLQRWVTLTNGGAFSNPTGAASLYVLPCIRLTANT